MLIMVQGRSTDYTLLTEDDTDGGLMKIQVTYTNGIKSALKYYEDVIETIINLYTLSSGEKEWQEFFAK